MKSTLLTTTALIAFAGASFADGHAADGIAFSGEASAEYNDLTGFTTATEATATMTRTLDNGLTATASLTFETEDNMDGTFSAGSISLSSDNASLTFGTGLDAAVFTTVGDDYDIGQSANDDRDDFEEQLEGIVGTYSMGETTLVVSSPLEFGASSVDTDKIEVGVTTSVAGFALAAAATGAGEAAATVSGTVAGATISLGGATTGASGDVEWDAEVSYTISPVTVSASIDETEAWTVGAAFDGGAYGVSAEYNSDETWEVGATYAANGISVAAEYNSAEEIVVGATYDMGNGLMVGAGMEADESLYAFATYDLGNGAEAYGYYTDSDVELEEVGPSEVDVNAGITVGVSFTF